MISEPMKRAFVEAGTARHRTSPNPWVGAVLWGPDGEISSGATCPPGGPHAEVVALAAAGTAAEGATLYVTLEPCAHRGRTGPCTEAIAASGVARVVVGTLDPDPQVDGRGIAALEAAGIAVEVGDGEPEISEQLAPYLKHRATGRPWVVLKLGVTLDGRIAAPDGSSRWITGPGARRDAHRLRACSDAIVVGAGTVRSDDPSLTVRLGTQGEDDAGIGVGEPAGQPLRVVLGRIPPDARVKPALEMSGELDSILDELGKRGVIQVLVEGGATVAHEFHSAGLVDRYVLYVAPALFGGDDARGMFSGTGVPEIGGLWRGRFVSVQRMDPDLRIEVERVGPIQVEQPDCEPLDCEPPDCEPPGSAKVGTKGKEVGDTCSPG